jgi:hypothetical protein
MCPFSAGSDAPIKRFYKDQIHPNKQGTSTLALNIKYPKRTNQIPVKLSLPSPLLSKSPATPISSTHRDRVLPNQANFTYDTMFPAWQSRPPTPLLRTSISRDLDRLNVSETTDGNQYVSHPTVSSNRIMQPNPNYIDLYHTPSHPMFSGTRPTQPNHYFDDLYHAPSHPILSGKRPTQHNQNYNDVYHAPFHTTVLGHRPTQCDVNYSPELEHLLTFDSEILSQALRMSLGRSAAVTSLDSSYH